MTLSVVYCDSCGNSIEFDSTDCTETEQEETFMVKKCNECGKPNAIYWSPSIDFSSSIANEKDLKEFDIED